MLKSFSNINLSLFLIVLHLTNLGFASKANKSNSKILESNKEMAIHILKKYNSTAAVEMQTHRQVTKKTLGTTVDTDGVLIYSKNKIYFKAEKPTQTEIIYNKNVWVIEYPDLELDDKANRKVTIFNSDKVPFIKTIAELMATPEHFFTEKTVITEKDDFISIESDKIKNASIKKFVVVLDKKEKLMSSILLTDDLNTDTIFKIQKTEFLKTAPKNKFNYKKIKTDEILKP